MLVSNFADPRQEMVLNWKDFAWTGGAAAEIRTVDATHDFSAVRTECLTGESASLRLTLKAPALALIRPHPTDRATAKRILSASPPANRLVF